MARSTGDARHQEYDTMCIVRINYTLANTYLLGWEQTDVFLHAEQFETVDAAKSAIEQARQDGTIKPEERATILYLTD
jgi:hypothetical protein